MLCLSFLRYQVPWWSPFLGYLCESFHCYRVFTEFQLVAAFFFKGEEIGRRSEPIGTEEDGPAPSFVVLLLLLLLLFLFSCSFYRVFLPSFKAESVAGNCISVSRPDGWADPPIGWRWRRPAHFQSPFFFFQCGVCGNCVEKKRKGVFYGNGVEIRTPEETNLSTISPHLKRISLHVLFFLRILFFFFVVGGSKPKQCAKNTIGGDGGPPTH